MLISKNIILRPLRLSDWECTLKWRNDTTIKQMALMHPFPITEPVEKEWYEGILKSKSDKNIYLTITRKNDEPIGYIALNNINYTHRNCRLGIIIGDQGSRGKGLGTEAMKLAINYAFNTLNLKKITLEVLENNLNAIRLYRKLGFIEEGNLKYHYFSESIFYNVLIFSLFKS